MRWSHVRVIFMSGISLYMERRSWYWIRARMVSVKVIQSNVALTRSNLSRYYIRKCHGVSIARIWEKIDRVITAPHCITYVLYTCQSYQIYTKDSSYTVWIRSAHGWMCIVIFLYILLITPHDDVIKWKHFRVTGPFCGECTSDRWIPHTKASDVELWCFLWSGPE